MAGCGSVRGHEGEAALAERPCCYSTLTLLPDHQGGLGARTGKCGTAVRRASTSSSSMRPPQLAGRRARRCHHVKCTLLGHQSRGEGECWACAGMTLNPTLQQHERQDLRRPKPSTPNDVTRVSPPSGRRGRGGGGRGAPSRASSSVSAMSARMRAGAGTMCHCSACARARALVRMPPPTSSRRPFTCACSFVCQISCN